MNLLKKLFLILFFFSLTGNLLKAEEKVSYIDIDYIISNTSAGKSLLTTLKNEEQLIIEKFNLSDEDFKNKEKQIPAKKNLLSKEELTKELKSLNIKYEKYRINKIKQIDDLKAKRNRNIVNFLYLTNPIIEKYMKENSIYMLIDKKNVFIASKDYDITNNLIELINNQIKNIEIK